MNEQNQRESENRVFSAFIPIVIFLMPLWMLLAGVTKGLHFYEVAVAACLIGLSLMIKNPIIKAFGILVALQISITLISFVLTGDKTLWHYHRGHLEGSLWVVLGLVFYLLSARGYCSWTMLGKAVRYGLAVQALVVALQLLGYDPIYFALQVADRFFQDYVRPDHLKGGSFWHSNFISAFCALAVPFFWKVSKNNWAFYLAAAALLAFVASQHCSSAIFAILSGVAFLLILDGKRHIWLAAGAFLAGGAVYFLFFDSGLRELLGFLNYQGGVESLGARTVVWKLTLQQWWGQKNILGLGLVSWEALWQEIKPQGWAISWSHVHNEYLEILIELGLPGLFLAVAYIFRSLAAPFRDPGRPELQAAACVVLVMAVLGLGGFVTRLPPLAFLFIATAGCLDRALEAPPSVVL